jgi:hypothetical protein
MGRMAKKVNFSLTNPGIHDGGLLVLLPPISIEQPSFPQPESTCTPKEQKLEFGLAILLKPLFIHLRVPDWLADHTQYSSIARDHSIGTE